MFNMNDNVYETMDQENIKIVIEHSAVLRRKNEEVFRFLQERLKEWHDYAQTVGHEFTFEM